MWLGWTVYTPDVERWPNNLGAARVEFGDFDQAEAVVEDALERDPEYPIPFCNLALLHAIRGDLARVERWLGEARKRGYEGESVDQLIHRSQASLARIEGRRIPTQDD